MIVAWTVALAHSAPCDAPATFQDLSRVLLAGEQAIRTADRTALAAAEIHAEALIRCLAEPIGPAEVASFMRLKGIAWFVRKDRDLARRWIESARGADPAYALPVTLIPNPHPLRTLYEGVEVRPVDAVSLPLPTRGWLEVDGRRSSHVPAEHPWLLQWRGPDGAVISTVLGDGRPEDWPYAVRSSADRASFVAGAGGQLDLRGGPGSARVGLTPSLVLPAPGPVSVELGAHALFTGVPVVDETEVRLVPGLSAGARVWLATGEVSPFVGAGLVGTSHPGRPLALGALGAAGVRVGQEQFVELGLRGGWSDGPVVEAGLGWGFSLR